MVDPPAHDRKLVFCHIPKTAGVTARALIGMNFREEEILHVRDPLDFIENVRAEELDPYRFIHGHFGIEVAELFSDPPALITFLRDPVRRVLSYYRFLRSFDPSETFGDEASARRVQLAHETNLEKFVQSEDLAVAIALTNRHVTFLSSVGQGFSGEERLANAKENLARFAFVGITERMDESMQLLASSFDWCPPLQGPVLNRSDGDSLAVDEKVIGLIRERNRLDIELYSHALERFEGEYRAMVQGLLDREFEAELEANPDKLGTPPFSMTRAIQGRGWYERESDASGAVWRVSGPLSESTVYLPKQEGRRERLLVTVQCAVTEEVLDSFRFRVNGRILVPELLSVSSQARRYGAILPIEKEQSSRVWRVDFLVDETLRPVDIIEGNPDYRELGIGVSEVDVVALEE